MTPRSTVAAVASAFSAAVLLWAIAGCSNYSIQPAGTQHPPQSFTQTVSSAPPTSPNPTLSAAATFHPDPEGSRQDSACASLTFSSDFRRLFRQEAKFASPKRDGQAGQGYRVTCVISPEDGRPSSLGHAQFDYVTGGNAGCDKTNLESDPDDSAGWYATDGKEWRYTVCTKLGFASVLYRQGMEGRPADLATISRLAHSVADGSWEIEAVIGPQKSQ